MEKLDASLESPERQESVKFYFCISYMLIVPCFGYNNPAVVSGSICNTNDCYLTSNLSASYCTYMLLGSTALS